MKKLLKFGARPLTLYVYAAKVERVVDADTLYVDFDLGFNIRFKEFVRLLKVDTPEIFGPKRTPEGKWASLYTKLWCTNRESEYEKLREEELKPEYLNELMKDAKFINVYIDMVKYNNADKFGRCLGEVFKDGTKESLNEALMRMGWPESPKSWGIEK